MSKLCEKPLLFPVPQQLGRNRVLPGNHGFFSFRHWLLVEPLEWNKIRISGDLSSPLTRYRLSFCRRLLPNGIIVRFFPRSSKKTDSSYSSFSFRIGSSLVLLSLMISWSHHFLVVRANARGTILSIACACFSLSRQRSLSSIKRSKAHGAEVKKAQ